MSLDNMVIQTAKCFAVDRILKPLFQEGLYEGDIIHVYTEKDFKSINLDLKPFFSKFYLIYIYCDERKLKLEKDSLKLNEHTRYVLICNDIKQSTKYSEMFPAFKYINLYFMKPALFERYVKAELPQITEGAIKALRKRIGYKINRLDFIISSLSAYEKIDEKIISETVENYNTLSLNDFTFYSLTLDFRVIDEKDSREKAKKTKCLKYIYNYRFNAKFLIKLLITQLDELIKYKLDYCAGKFNATNKHIKYREMGVSKVYMDKLISIMENVDTDLLMKKRYLLEVKTSNVQNFLTLFKFLKVR